MTFPNFIVDKVVYKIKNGENVESNSKCKISKSLRKTDF